MFKIFTTQCNLLLVRLMPFLRWWPQVNRHTLRADAIAGITGAVIVLPQGVAFATIAGLPPQYGLYTAMVTPIIAALFGSSYHLISGPTTAISIVVFATISQYAEATSSEFISLTLTLTFLAGVYQLAFGLARLGALVNFVSHTVVVGFTAGAAILIATSQIKHVLGIAIPKGESFIHNWIEIFNMAGNINGYVLLIAVVTLLTAVLTKVYFPRLPNLLLGMIAGSLVALFFSDSSYSIELIGKIPAHLPPLSSPDFSLTTIKMLAPQAFAIALLGLIEAVSISQSIATKSHQRINANQEFTGQGLSNIAGSFFSSYAGSGSFTRSGINYSSGAQTPMSAIFAAVFLMLIILLVAPLTAYLPIAAMGGIIFIVAYNLVDFHHIKQITRYSRSETAILITTFLSTLFLELEFAIYLGVLLSLVFFLARTSSPEIPALTVDTDKSTGKRKFINTSKKPLDECPQFKIMRIDMSIYFGSINHIRDKIQRIVEIEGIKHILIVASRINFIDLSGAEMLVNENNRLKKMGGGLYFTGMKASVYEFAARACFIKKIGSNRFFDHKSEAINTIYKCLELDTCANCNTRIFIECPK